MQADRIARLLPGIWRDAARPGSPLAALLAVMEAQQAGAEAVLADLDAWFDPRRAPDAFVAMLAGWVALDPYLDAATWEAEGARGRVGLDPDRLRDLTARAADLARRRGTAGALAETLELATGLRGFRLEAAPPGPDGQPVPFHARLVAPAASRPLEPLLRLVLRAEKPAFVTVELAFEPDG
jgi:phage tail-like protein